MAEKKTKRNTPKVRYQGRTYEIVRMEGKRIRINDGFAEFWIEADLTSPCNKEAREIFKGMV